MHAVVRLPQLTINRVPTLTFFSRLAVAVSARAALTYAVPLPRRDLCVESDRYIAQPETDVATKG